MTTWILLRGLTRESRHWGRFPALLHDALDAAHVVTLDLPGNGRLCEERSPTNVDRVVDACRAELLRRNVAPPFFLLGMSLGAMVTVAWAARFQREACGCVLINTSMRPFCPFYWRLRPASYPTLARLLVMRDPVASERLILRLTSRVHTTDGPVPEEWSTYRREFRVTRGNALRQLAAAARFRAPAVRPDTRVMVLASTNDALVDVRCSRKLAEAWRCDLAEHPHAGHDLPLDDPLWVVRVVGAWAAEAPSTDTPRGPSSNRVPAGAGSPHSEHDPAT